MSLMKKSSFEVRGIVAIIKRKEMFEMIFNDKI
jgi:hypothetical protein